MTQGFFRILETGWYLVYLPEGFHDCKEHFYVFTKHLTVPESVGDIVSHLNKTFRLSSWAGEKDVSWAYTDFVV